MRSVIGARVAAARKLRGLTQQELAGRARVSFSLLSKVEAGQVPASPGFVAAVARALRVELGELTGQPYRGDTPASDRADAAVTEVRLALWDHDPLDDPEVPGRRVLAELRPELARAAALRGAARYVQLAEALPGLVRQLLAATATTPPGHALEDVYGALADVYSMAQTCTRILGYTDLAALAVERMAWAAERSGDPLWRAVATEKRTQVHLVLGAYDAGLRALALEAARVGTAGDDRPQALAVAGRLHLRAAILAARGARAERARDELAAAAEYAARLPSGGPDWYGLAFGTPSVRIHQVAAEVELGEGTRAVQLAAGWDPAGLITPDGVGHHHIDLARGRLMHGDRDGALAELATAREAAPQMARHHPMVRETLDVLAHTSRRSSEQLRQLASWIGLS